MNELTLVEAGALIGRSPSTLKHQVRSGRLKGRKIGRAWVVTRREIERYARENARGGK